jgi:hypothetical protein
MWPLHHLFTYSSSYFLSSGINLSVECLYCTVWKCRAQRNTDRNTHRTAFHSFRVISYCTCLRLLTWTLYIVLVLYTKTTTFWKWALFLSSCRQDTKRPCSLGPLGTATLIPWTLDSSSLYLGAQLSMNSPYPHHVKTNTHFRNIVILCKNLGRWTTFK